MLSAGDLRVVARQWAECLERAVPAAKAADLYEGRSFAYAKQAAMLLDADFDVLSAGLGYVRGDTRIPSYDLAAGCGPGGVGRRIDGFNPEEWWRAINHGRFASKLKIERRPLIMIALTRNYARMARPMLEQLSAHTDRVRIFGAGLAPFLPPSLAGCLLPYDDRIALKGTKGDFAGRALLVHAQLISVMSNNRGLLGEHAAVSAMLTRSRPARRLSRKTVSDEAIAHEVRMWLHEEPTISHTRILRRLRDLSGIACSEERARRIMMGLMV